jgi:hypothetical protein
LAKNSLFKGKKEPIIMEEREKGYELQRTDTADPGAE